MFPRLTVRNKLLAGFGIVFILLAAMVWLSLSNMKAINAQLLEIAQERYPKVALANTAIKHALNIDRLVRSLLVQQEAAVVSTTIGKIEAERQANTEALKKMESMLVDQAGRDHFKQITDSRAVLSAHYPKLFELARAGDAAGINTYLVTEFAAPLDGFISMLEDMAAFQDEAIKQKMEAAESAYRTAITVVAASSLLMLVSGIAIALILSNAISGPLINALRMSKEIASGNLAQPVQAQGKTGKDEVLLLMNALEEMRVSLRQLIGSMQEDSNQVADSAHQLSAMASQVAEGSQRQSAATASAAATIEELTVSIAQVADSSNEASNVAHGAGVTASAGSKDVKASIEHIGTVSQMVGETSKEMNVLEGAIAQIDNIVTVIREVADQTNLLALNAAIEAARAGESGRGFAVVADEVRKLAERSATSAHEITQVIRTIQAGTLKVSESMKESLDCVDQVSSSASIAGKSMQEIERAAQQVVDTIRSINSALNEQSCASQTLAQSVEQVAQMSEENAATVEVLASTSSQLNTLSENLQSAASRFRI